MRVLTYDPLWKTLAEKKMNKTELAEKAEVSRGIITRMAKGEMITLDAVVKICKALDCDISEVVSIKKS